VVLLRGKMYIQFEDSVGIRSSVVAHFDPELHVPIDLEVRRYRYH